MKKEKEMTFFEHLGELRGRLMVIAISVVVFSGVSFYFIDPIVEIFKRPASELNFVYLTPPELFLAYIKISLVIGIIASLPVILLEIWLFVKPGLQKSERLALFFTILFGTICFAGGVLFSYTVILPITLDFFLKYSTPEITAMFSFGNYVGFITTIMLAFGAAFELPIVVVILARVGIVNYKILQKVSKYVFLIIIVLAALLTPPDIISQLLLAGPMFLLFEISVLLARIFGKRKERLEKEKLEEEDDTEIDNGIPAS